MAAKTTDTPDTTDHTETIITPAPVATYNQNTGEFA